jgi:hypothetical protein
MITECTIRVVKPVRSSVKSLRMRTLRLVFACVACTGVVGLTPATATAQPAATGSQRVAIARLTFEGKIPEGLQDLFAQRLVQGLSAARFEVLRGSDVAQRLAGTAGALATCQNAACYPAMAGALGASYLITAAVAESNKTYTMILEIINGRTGAVLASNRERCETCGVEEAGEKMGLAASALRERLEAVSRGPAHLMIRSRPPGAAILMDGRATGVTPFDAELAGGTHHLQLSLSGHEPVARSFTVVSGVDEAVDLDLAAIPSTFPYRTVGWGTLAGGAALLVAGIVTMSLDSQEIGCSASDKDVNNHCPWVRSTKWWGAAMMGVGAAAATTGGFFLYMAPRSGVLPATAVASYHRRF